MGVELDVDKALSNLNEILNHNISGLSKIEYDIVCDAINNLKNMREALSEMHRQPDALSIFGQSQCSRCGHERRAEDYLGFCSECGEDGPCAANKEGEIPSNNLFVAMLMPFHDGSGEAQLLGVYSTKEKAEANCYRALKTLGYDQPTEIFETVLNEGCNG